MTPIALIKPVRIAARYAKNQILKVSSDRKKPIIKEVQGRKEEGKGDIIDIIA